MPLKCFKKSYKAIYQNFKFHISQYRDLNLGQGQNTHLRSTFTTANDMEKTGKKNTFVNLYWYNSYSIFIILSSYCTLWIFMGVLRFREWIMNGYSRWKLVISLQTEQMEKDMFLSDVWVTQQHVVRWFQRVIMVPKFMTCLLGRK